MKADLISLSEAKRLPNNAKLHDLNDISDSFREFGFVDRLIVNSVTGNLVSGHGRIDALEEMKKKGKDAPQNVMVQAGEWFVPIDYIECEAEKEDALAIRLNVSQMKGGQVDIGAVLGTFDMEKLFQIAAEAQAKGFLQATGLDGKAVKFMEKELGLEEIKEDQGAQIDKAEELREKWGVESGQLWRLGEHRMICGDCTDRAVVEKMMGEDRYTVMFTDPPYGVSIGAKNRFLNSFQRAGMNLENIESDDASAEDLMEMLAMAFSLNKDYMADDCSVFVCAPQGGQLGLMMMMMMRSGLEVKHVINWVKNQPTFSLGRLDYEYQHEPILFTWKKTHKRIKGGQFQTSVWTVDKPRANAEHPTMKPVELPLNAILNHSEEGDIIGDIFLGSGTTMIAAEQSNRKCRAVEISPAYCAVAIQRWVDMTGGEPKLIEA